MKRISQNILFLFVILALSSSAYSSPFVEVITLNDDIINPITMEYITGSIDRAEKNGAQCLIIMLDTPGGLLNSTRAIVKKMMSADVPVVVYIAPGGSRAGSAGVFITLASHIAVMAPSTNIGAAHPVVMGGGGGTWKRKVKKIQKYLEGEKEGKKDDRGKEKGTGEKDASKQPPDNKKEDGSKEEEGEYNPMSDKIMHDTIAWVKTIAKNRGRNVDWAVSAVEESISSTEDEALKSGVVDFICKDLQEVLQKIDGKKIRLHSKDVVLHTASAEIRHIRMSTRQKILNVLINPNIAYILMMLGFYGLLFEITHPGIGFPGIAGIICIILAFLAFQSLPINYAGLALILLAIILFIAEVKVQSFGLLTLGGLVSLILGSLMLIDSPDSFMRVSMSVVLPVALATFAIVFFLLTLVVKARSRKTVTGMEGLVGSHGTAETVIDTGGGRVFIHGELWNARSKGEIEKGRKVRVNRVDGLTLLVEESDEGDY